MPEAGTIAAACSMAFSALVGAKVGANVHSHRAMPGDVQLLSPQVDATLSDVRLRQATGCR
jgi:hypothetical protein